MTYYEEVLRYGGLPPAHPLAFGPLTGASTVLVGGAGLWIGHAIEETTGGAPARVTVNDSGVSGAGQQLAPLTLGGGESRLDLLPGAGVLFVSGLTVTVTAGTVAGVLYAVLLTPEEMQQVRAAGLLVAVSQPVT